MKVSKIAGVGLVTFFLFVLICSSFIFSFALPTPANTAVTLYSLTKINAPNETGYVIPASGVSGTLGVQGNWVVPSVTCLGPDDLNIYVEFNMYGPASNDGSDIRVFCASKGVTPTYNMDYVHDGKAFLTGLSISPGQTIQTSATYSFSTELASIKIKDVSSGKSFSHTLTDPKGSSVSVAWFVQSNTLNTLPIQFTALKTSGDKATIGTASGALGSFLSIYNVYERIMVDLNNGHVLAKPTPISPTSSSFSIDWFQKS